MSVSAEDLPDSAASARETPAPPAESLVAACHSQQAFVHRERGAPNWLFTWTTTGNGWFRQGGVDVLIQPGDLVIAGPDVTHDYGVARGAPGWTLWWVHCQARSTWQPWLRPYEVGSRLYAVPGVAEAVRPRISQAFERLHTDARWPGDGAPAAQDWSRPAIAWGATARELALNAVEEILLLSIGGSAGASARGDDVTGDDRVRQVEALLQADPAAPHTVASLAARVALSPSRLAHLFVEQTGRTPMQAVRDARLRHAARLLEATDLTVEAIAAASGFASPFHFSRVFRDRFGTPPATYRTAYRSARSTS
jgi:AraC family transcriptional regulator, arabinose operon regulatory protein